MERYIYTQLPPTVPRGRSPLFTRIMTLYPGTTDDPIHCSLRITDVQHTEPYETLSYTWGAPTGILEPYVLCDGSPISITPNLNAALRALRYLNAVRLLWVDAICIDQQNLEERGRQVGYMRCKILRLKKCRISF